MELNNINVLLLQISARIERKSFLIFSFQKGEEGSTLKYIGKQRQ
jgi:hypothetical protein